jgi:hypothetical protein
MTYKLLENISDLEDLAAEVTKLIDEIGLKENQAVCQKLFDGPDDWFTGIGSLLELEEKEEKKYHVIQDKLKGSLIEKYINKYRGFRTRIMALPPKRCYSIHRDLSYRIHIPIIGNIDQSLMIWPDDQICAKLVPGGVYLTNTTKSHTFVNGDQEMTRIHIVMCVSSSDVVKILSGKSDT